MTRADRSSFWADVVCANLVQARCEPGAMPGDFHGHVRQSVVHGISVSQIRASAQHVVRTPEYLARANADEFIVVLQRSGQGRMRQDGREVWLAPGDLALCSSSRIYDLGFDADFWQTVLIVPAQTLRAMAPSIDAVTATRLPCEPAAVRLLAGLAESVAELPLATAPVAAEAAARGLLDTLVAFGLPDHRAPARSAATLQQALDALDQGVLVLSPDLRLSSSNACGLAFLQQATHLRLVRGRVVAAAGASPLFEAAWQRVVHTGQPESCALTGGGTGNDPVATLSRLPGASRVASDPGLVLVVITSPGRQRVASVRQLMQVYGLTPAEGRLAHAFVAGCTLTAFEQSEGIKRSTARTHLQSVLRKTGARRQSELMRLLTALPSARGG